MKEKKTLGFCANLFLGMFDVQRAGFTQAAAQMIDADYVAAPTMNYFFMVASCLVMTAVGTFVTERFVAPRFEGQDISKYEFDQRAVELSSQQSRGLRTACVAFAITIAVLIAMCLGGNPVLGDEETGELLVSSAPFMQGLILIISLLLFVPGCVFGFASGKYRTDKDLFADVTEAFRDMAPYIVLCFSARSSPATLPGATWELCWRLTGPAF